MTTSLHTRMNTHTHVGVIYTTWHKLITIRQTCAHAVVGYLLWTYSTVQHVCFCLSVGLLRWQVHILIVLLVLAAHRIKGFKGTKGKLAGRGRSSSSAGDSGPNFNTLPLFEMCLSRKYELCKWNATNTQILSSSLNILWLVVSAWLHTDVWFFSSLNTTHTLSCGVRRQECCHCRS